MTILAPPTSDATAGTVSRQSPVGAPKRSRRRGKWVEHTKLYLALFALMAPMLVGLVLFTYYPQFSTIKYSFFKWDGGALYEEFRGLENYRRAFTGDSLFWPTFNLVLILLAANVIKMVPSILAAIALHRLRSERWQYIYRVLFVLPLVIPALVGLLIWKSFYDPLIGPLNKFLNATGLMNVLAWLDIKMPALSGNLTPVIARTIDPVFYSVWGMLVAGILLLTTAGGLRSIRRAWLWWLIVCALLATLMGVGEALGARFMPSEGATPTPLAWGVIARFVIWVIGSILIAQFAGKKVTRWLGGIVLAAGIVAMVLAMIWTTPVGGFDTGTPGWLANSKLIVPSLIIWGFPWVGTIGVLIYLAGLQAISQDIYEAAEIDGVSSLGRLFSIELPLIMVQFRINLIFLTIGTLTDYGFFLVLLGPQGGPGGVGVVPGLYMYRKALTDGEFGYACALGIILAAIVLLITVLYQKYVQVEK